MSNTYGGYNMPGDEFFYLSSMYSDKLLTEFLPKVKNQAYQRYMQIQKDILNGNEINGSLEKNSKYQYYFKKSLELNEYFNFPLGSVYADITEQDFYLDIVDKMKFLKKFKSFNTPISNADIIANPDIFSSVIHFRIGNYAFNKFYILKDKYQRVFIGIKNSNTDGLTSTALNRLISEGTSDNPTTFCLWKDIPCASYNYTGTLSSIMSNSTTAGMKKITIQKSGSASVISPSSDNNWTIMMTYASSRFGNYIYSSTNCSLTSESKSTLSFDVPQAFLNDINSRNTVISCIVIQRPNRKAIFAYSPSDNTEPWLTLGNVDRPVSIANVKIYEYDDSTCRYLRRIPIEINNFNKEFNDKVLIKEYDEKNYFDNVIFPSIYNFSNLNKSIRIELIEFSPKVSNTSFDNNIISLFNYPDYDNDNLDKECDYSADRYLKYLTWLNTNKSNASYGSIITNMLNTLTGFNPKNVFMDYGDYMSSGLTLRQYKFGKLMELIESDPYIYAEYIKYMDQLNFGIIHKCGSPKYFKFNTGITTDSDLTGTNPVVTDDSFTCVNKNDEVYFFSEPHSYIKIHSNNQHAYCAVYVGGRMITPTRVKSKLNDIYIFLPCSKMKKYIEEAMTKLSSESDTLLNKNNLIIVEMYSKIDRDPINQIHSTNVFESTSIDHKIFDGDENFNFKLSDLVIYNKITGEYIPLSKFDITAVLHRATIDFDDGTTDKVIGAIKDIIYLGTNLTEFYMTKDNARIILEEDTVDFEFPKDDTFDGGKKDNYSGFLNKEWVASDLKFKVNDPKLIGTEIEFVYSPVAYNWDIPFEKFTKDESSGKYNFEIGGFIGKNDLKYFDLYIDGEYLNHIENYLSLPSSASTDARIKISIPDVSKLKQWYTNTNHIIQLRYNPTTYNKTSNCNKCTLLSKYHPWFDTTSKYDRSKVIFNYSIFTTNLYTGVKSYFNSECSKVYTTQDTKDTYVILPYKWNINRTTIDLQEKLNVMSIHPILKNIPCFMDINEDLQFYYNTTLKTPKSIIDQLCYSESN